jgi:hypothetical protein
MIDPHALNQIENAIRDFKHGNPQHFMIMFAEGVFFELDVPFEEDLKEPLIPVSIGIYEWSPHLNGKPQNARLADCGNGSGDEIVEAIEKVVDNLGIEISELIFEYSEFNSNGDLHLFHSSIPNDRTKTTASDIEVPEEFA